jgi:hypothetical protein
MGGGLELYPDDCPPVPSDHSLWIREEHYSTANEWFEVVEG